MLIYWLNVVLLSLMTVGSVTVLTALVFYRVFEKQAVPVAAIALLVLGCSIIGWMALFQAQIPAPEIIG